MSEMSVTRRERAVRAAIREADARGGQPRELAAGEKCVHKKATQTEEEEEEEEEAQTEEKCTSVISSQVHSHTLPSTRSYLLTCSVTLPSTTPAYHRLRVYMYLRYLDRRHNGALEVQMTTSVARASSAPFGASSARSCQLGQPRRATLGVGASPSPPCGRSSTRTRCSASVAARSATLSISAS